MRRISVATFFVVALVGTLGLLSAGVSSLSIAPVRPVPDHPFTLCDISGQTGINYLGAEVEPWVAVNPTDPNNIVGAFMQDVWSNGGANGLVAASSRDGGQTWRISSAPFTTCSGGTPGNGGAFERAADPWVTFAANGDAYQIDLAWNGDLANLTADLTTAILLSKSTDGGRTWGEPVTLIRDTFAAHLDLNDKPSIMADRTDANLVYAVWDRTRFPSDTVVPPITVAYRGDIMFSRTTDAGASWEPARDILPLNKLERTVGNQIVVLPDAGLVDVFLRIRFDEDRFTSRNTDAVIRSSDKGATWSRPTDIALDPPTVARDPDTGMRVSAGGLPDIAVDPNDGTMYVVWTDTAFSGGAVDDIALSRSTDGGETWSKPIKVNQTNGVHAFTPSVEVAADGTVAVTYYDFRYNTPDPATLPTDYFLVRSHDHGVTWGDEARLTPTSFDLNAAPVLLDSFLFIGHYQGLARRGGGFVPFFVQTNTGEADNRTDAFFTLVAEP